MNAYIIERDITGVDQMSDIQLVNASAVSNAAIEKLAGKVKWIRSFVTKDRIFCHYLAETEDSIREHARLSGFPASRITPVAGMIGPETANG
ncbi:DUF4242 domain-containing protein [Sphingomonas sp. BIUV-7]|uniref:DUF4242 domain-containing protein n=1 Tax=Sphingomonas natans TaxID=3063330 RepID=A0ABT8YDD0_9SPHN|nr:DUF4242 domain-containing protein [Sphingomonas sp. BIUV-7]MDO6416335.1 DUF4242 domain-containing protein [Sphingomonas sp. BIUV-7]